jgi:hypothetical protein
VLVARTASNFPLRSASVPWRLGQRFRLDAIRNINDRERSIAPGRAAIENKLINLEGLLSICAWCKRIHDGAYRGSPWIDTSNRTQIQNSPTASVRTVLESLILWIISPFKRMFRRKETCRLTRSMKRSCTKRILWQHVSKPMFRLLVKHS